MESGRWLVLLAVEKVVGRVRYEALPTDVLGHVTARLGCQASLALTASAIDVLDQRID